MTQAEIEKLLELTFTRFIKFEKFLLINDLSERCLVHKFSIHLMFCMKKMHSFENYDVDCEYNRVFPEDISNEYYFSNNDRIVVPDIIIHKRGRKFNILAFEFKKSRGLASWKKFNIKDVEKIQSYIEEDDLHYKFAVVVNFPFLDKNKYLSEFNYELYKRT